ncbi:unnamed protein product [Parnassius mnemosyne]|uniref:DUF5641 domain-containing protein n=1 Tax=Parnassius mnemosyne TaxID=213953 RepID=A0AAV1K4C8_9NEOP
MDDLKLFASSRSHLVELLNITCDFSNSIGMELGTDKCAVLHVERGRVANSEGIDLSMPINIRTLSEAETYRYLGMSQNIGVDEAGMKQSVCDVFYARLTKVLNSLLSGVNKTHAYNGWVMPVLMYTFGILRWTQTELNALDRKVRTIMTSHRMHHPRSSSSKWLHDRGSAIREGTVVVVCDEHLPPLQWKLARVHAVHPGSDQVTRVVTLKAGNTIFKRPVVKICPLPLE